MSGSTALRNPSNVVLVADSDAERRQRIASVVREFQPDATIVEVSSGLKLVDAILDYNPTLGFVGVHLDDLSGPEALALARHRGGSLPCLILVAARVFAQWKEVAQTLGAYEVLKLPLDRAHIGNILHANERRHQPTSVLLASANPTGRSVVGRVLAKSGFNLTVDETDNGRHALKLLANGKYGLAFVDVRLPDLDGMEIACQLQNNNVATRLTLLTLGDPEPIAYAARYFGVDFVLRMPFFARDIDLALHHAFDLRRPYLLNALTAAPAPTALFRVCDLPAKRASA